MLLRNLKIYERKIVAYRLLGMIARTKHEKKILRIKFLMNHMKNDILDEEIESFIQYYFEAGSKKKNHRLKMTNQ